MAESAGGSVFFIQETLPKHKATTLPKINLERILKKLFSDLHNNKINTRGLIHH